MPTQSILPEGSPERGDNAPFAALGERFNNVYQQRLRTIERRGAEVTTAYPKTYELIKGIVASKSPVASAALGNYIARTLVMLDEEELHYSTLDNFGKPKHLTEEGQRRFDNRRKYISQRKDEQDDAEKEFKRTLTPSGLALYVTVGELIPEYIEEDNLSRPAQQNVQIGYQKSQNVADKSTLMDLELMINAANGEIAQE